MKDTNIYDCKAYACYLKDANDLIKSTSGGAFYALAKQTIQKQGVVFGASIVGDAWNVQHVMATTVEELQPLRKSKYVQSRIGDSYIQTKKLLENGTEVMFSGTSCQVAGLRAFLGKGYDNLLLVEIICHGVPNQKLLKTHIEYMSEVFQKKIVRIGFREKEKSWEQFSVKYFFEDGTDKEVAPHADGYTWAFEAYYSLRESCYRCPFQGLKSGADITIGDFWKIDSFHPGFKNEKGTSAVVVKTKRGQTAFDEVAPLFEIQESKVGNVASYNIWLTSKRRKNKYRQKFFSLFQEGQRDIKGIVDTIKSGPLVELALFGSYSLRTIAHELKWYDSLVDLTYQITGASVMSLFDAKEYKEADLNVNQSNAYRYAALKNDCLKLTENRILEVPCRYILIDFLEERNPILKTNGSCYSMSEFFEQLHPQVIYDNEVERISPADVDLEIWKKRCDYFIDILQKVYAPQQIILTELYLTENYGNPQMIHKFDYVAEIRKMNERLKLYYDYFAERTGCIRVNCVDSQFDYCPESFAYGCSPEYYSHGLYKEFAEKIAEMAKGI